MPSFGIKELVGTLTVGGVDDATIATGTEQFEVKGDLVPSLPTNAVGHAVLAFRFGTAHLIAFGDYFLPMRLLWTRLIHAVLVVIIFSGVAVVATIVSVWVAIIPAAFVVAALLDGIVSTQAISKLRQIQARAA